MTKVVALTDDGQALEQRELVARQKAETAKLTQSHADQRRALEARQHRELLALERQHVQQIGGLWKAQGRKLGAGLVRVLEGRAGR